MRIRTGEWSMNILLWLWMLNWCGGVANMHKPCKFGIPLCTYGEKSVKSLNNLFIVLRLINLHQQVATVYEFSLPKKATTTISTRIWQTPRMKRNTSTAREPKWHTEHNERSKNKKCARKKSSSSFILLICTITFICILCSSSASDSHVVLWFIYTQTFYFVLTHCRLLKLLALPSQFLIW